MVILCHLLWYMQQLSVPFPSLLSLFVCLRYSTLVPLCSAHFLISFSWCSGCVHRGLPFSLVGCSGCCGREDRKEHLHQPLSFSFFIAPGAFVLKDVYQKKSCRPFGARQCSFHAVLRHHYSKRYRLWTAPLPTLHSAAYRRWRATAMPFTAQLYHDTGHKYHTP